MQVVTRYFSEFTPKQLSQFEALEGLYTEWNAKINVISRKDIGSLYEKHVLHSLSIAAVFDFPLDSRLLISAPVVVFPACRWPSSSPRSSFTW